MATDVSKEKEKILHVTPYSSDQLETCLLEAQNKNSIPIFKLGSAHEEWLHTNKTNYEEHITMVECSFLKKDKLEDICERLKRRIANQPAVQTEKFVNWGKTQAIPVISSSPTTLEELQKLIKAAAIEKLRVRCAGTGHSWAPIFSDKNNLLIHMENMKGVYDGGSRIRITPNKPNQVDIMTGATTGDFKKFQLANKLNLQANVILDVVQMVSVVATGCHGVGRDIKTPSDYVVKMRIIDADGKLTTFEPDNENSDRFKAIQANFGCFGVIYDMTIEVIPQVTVKVDNQYESLSSVFYNAGFIETLFKNNWSVEIFWFPFNSKRCLADYDPKEDKVWVRKINKVKGENKETENEEYYTWKDGKDFLSQEALLLMSPVIAENPLLTPLFAWSSFCTLQNIIYPEKTLYQELPHAIHFRQFIDVAPVNDMEFAFDINEKNYEKVLEIIQVVVETVQQYEKLQKYPLNIALEMRMMGFSDALLCPGSIGNTKYGGHGHVLYIEVLSLVDTAGWEDFCIDVAKKWMLLDGVPHLAKQWDFIPGIENHIYKRMESQIKTFTKQLKESNTDPKRMFLNDKLKKLLRI